MEKEEKDIRFVARFYRENRLNTTQAWQKLGIGKQRNNSILLYRLITIAAVTFLIAGFSWWWIYDRQDWIVIASSAHAVKKSRFRITAILRWQRIRPYSMTAWHTAKKTGTSL